MCTHKNIYLLNEFGFVEDANLHSSNGIQKPGMVGNKGKEGKQDDGPRNDFLWPMPPLENPL